MAKGQGQAIQDTSWHKRVYRQVEKPYGLAPEIAAAVRNRDHACQICDSERHLSVHHIIPRSEGGLDKLANLILLCSRCHDEVEIAGYRSRAEILDYTPTWCGPLEIIHKFESEEPTLNDWHSWVYGGARNPAS